MKSKRKLRFYKKKKTPFLQNFLLFALSVTVILTMALSVPLIRQRIIQPLYAVFSYSSDIFRALVQLMTPKKETAFTIIRTTVYPTLSLPDEDVLFAEDISEITYVDPLAEFRETPMPEDQINAAQWEFKDDYEASQHQEDIIEDDGAYHLSAPVFERSDLFNDGPTALSALLRFWGKTENQYHIAETLHPEFRDISVSLDNLKRYCEENYPELHGLIRWNGSKSLLVALINAGIPVLVPLQTHVVLPFFLNDDRLMRKYILVLGYQDGKFIYQDPQIGDNLHSAYDDFLADWYPFGRSYFILYPEDLESIVTEILSDDFDSNKNLINAAAKFENDSRMLPNDAIPQINYGTILYLQNKIGAAYGFFTAAAELTPPIRWVQYNNAYPQVSLDLGYADEVLEICGKQDSYNEELLVFEGWAAMQKGEADRAQHFFNRAAQVNENNPSVAYALKYMESQK